MQVSKKGTVVKMNIKKFKGYQFLIIGFIICLMLIGRQGYDKYYRNFTQEDFRITYKEEYFEDAAAFTVENENGDIKVFLKNYISLQEGSYNIELQYYAEDDNTNFQIFAGDYPAEDNTGIKIFINEDLKSENSKITASFTLDKEIDNLYIVAQTTDENFTIGRLTMTSEMPIYNDTYYWCFLVIIISLLAVFISNNDFEFIKPSRFNNQTVSSKNTFLIMLLIMGGAVFIASIPLFSEGLIWGHDTFFHLARIEGIERALLSGQFPVRVHGGLLNDYGYPNSLFYPELLLYIPAVLTILGVSMFAAFKSYIVILNILTIIIAYISFKKMINNRYIALAVSVIYLLSPYRLICLYHRMAVGEATAFTFIPLVIYGLYAIILKNKKDWWYLVIGATGVLQSHFITTEVIAILAIIVVLCSLKELFTKEKRFLYLIYAAVLTVLLNIWFLGPMLLMMMQLGLAVLGTGQGVFGFSTYEVDRLLGVSTVTTSGLKNIYPIGWVVIFALVFYILYRLAVKVKEEDRKIIKFTDMIAKLSVVLLIATTAFFPWEVITSIPLIGRMIDVIQFSHRLSTVITAMSMFVVGITIYLWFKNNKNSQIVACIGTVIILVITTMLMYETSITNATYVENKDLFENHIDNTSSIGQGEYLIEGSNTDIMVGEKSVILSDNETFNVTNKDVFGTKTSFSYTIDLSKGNNMIYIPVSYIPNYEVLVNGNEVPISKGEVGKVVFEAPVEEGDVTVIYKSPLTFRVFEAISLISFIAFINKNKISKKLKLDL